MSKIKTTIAILLGSNLLALALWIFLGRILVDVSVFLAWLLGFVFLFIAPAFVFLLGFLSSDESSSLCSLPGTIAIVLFMIASPLAVPYFKEQTVCNSTFDQALADAKSCDFLCFEKAVLRKQEAISFEYSYIRYGEPHNATLHFIPIDTSEAPFVWVRGKPEDDLNGNCIKEGSLHGYDHFPKHRRKPVLGTLVVDPAKHTEDSRQLLGIMMLCLNAMILFVWYRMSRPASSVDADS